MECSSIAFDETSSDWSALKKTPNFSAFHWSPHGSLVSIGQHFVATRVAHLPKSTETSLITESDQSGLNHQLLQLCTARTVWSRLCGPCIVVIAGYVFYFADKNVNKTVNTTDIRPGGYFIPSNCVTRERVAIIVPYRDREQHLKIFLNFMHSFLMAQQLEYAIFVVELVRPVFIYSIYTLCTLLFKKTERVHFILGVSSIFTFYA